MTDFITEMMETAGCKKQVMCEWACKDKEICNVNCEHFKTKQNVFPPFTAEKQLEIIKLIMKIEHFTLVDKEVSVTSMKNKNIGMWCKDATSYSSDFTQALAQLTTELMNAGELDKEKVKEVLEC